MKKIILAVGGLPGCGKSEAINYLQQKLNCPKIYFPQIIFDIIKEKNLEPTQENARALRESLRAEHGMGVMAKLSLPKVRAALETSDGVLIESLYSWEEYLTVKAAYGDEFKFLAVYAAPSVRYARLAQRAQRSLTLLQAQERDYSQLTTLNQGGPIALADFTVHNESALTQLYQELDNVLKKVNDAR